MLRWVPCRGGDVSPPVDVLGSDANGASCVACSSPVAPIVRMRRFRMRTRGQCPQAHPSRPDLSTCADYRHHPLLSEFFHARSGDAPIRMVEATQHREGDDGVSPTGWQD